MPQFQVTGARRSDGSAVQVTIAAADENEAEVMANERGILVQRAERLPEPGGSGVERGTTKARTTNCGACGQMIAKSADKCPHCGKPRTTLRNVILALVLVVLFVLLWGAYDMAQRGY